MHVPPLTALLTAVLMGLTAHFLPVLRFSFPLQIFAAIAVALAGLALGALSLRAFRRAGTTVSPVRVEETSALVTTGTYAITRNPMYAGLLLVLAGWFIYLGEAVNALFLILFVVIITSGQIRREERVLRQRFGQAYDDYCARVSRWIVF